MKATHLRSVAFLTISLLSILSGVFAMGTAYGEVKTNLISAPQAPPSTQFKSLILKEELAIGSVDGDENTTFGGMVTFIVDDQGNIYVMDWDAKQIRKFGPDGKFIRSIGRFGQGPGEFQTLFNVYLLKNGDLYIADNLQKRISFYNLEGSFIKQIELPENIDDILISPQGTYLCEICYDPVDDGQSDLYNKFIILDRQFKPIIELYKDTIEKNTFKAGLTLAQREALSINNSFKKPSPIKTMGEDGKIFIGRDDRYIIDIYSPDGKKVNSIQHECPPIKYDQKDKDRFFDTSESKWKMKNFSDSAIKEMRGLIEFPKYKPFFSKFIIMDGGRLGVLVNSSGYDSSTLDIFDQEGRFLGRVTAPISSYRLLLKKGKAYCVKPDANGYLFVKRYSYELK